MPIKPNSRHWKNQSMNLESGKDFKPEPKRPIADWKKSGKTGYIAHHIKTSGSDYFVTTCGVLLDRQYAVNATVATMQCVECREKTGGSYAHPI